MQDREWNRKTVDLQIAIFCSSIFTLMLPLSIQIQAALDTVVSGVIMKRCVVVLCAIEGAAECMTGFVQMQCKAPPFHQHADGGKILDLITHRTIRFECHYYSVCPLLKVGFVSTYFQLMVVRNCCGLSNVYIFSPFFVRTDLIKPFKINVNASSSKQELVTLQILNLMDHFIFLRI